MVCLFLALVGLLATDSNAFTSVRSRANFAMEPSAIVQGGSVQQPMRSTCLHISLDQDWSQISSDLSKGLTFNLGELDLSVPSSMMNPLEVVNSIGLTSELTTFEQLVMAGTPLLTISLAVILGWKIINPPEDFRKGVEPYIRGRYDPVQAKAYYARKRLTVIRRAAQVLRLSNAFITSLLLAKYVFRNEESQRPKLAKDLLELVTKLGPTAIKVGQALSVRPDLIAAEYADALSTLQDRVPPFESSAAKEILKNQLGGKRLSEIEGFTDSNDPVASASIGQVYKCRIEDKDVAVKVQRPNVLAEIALDLHLVREFAPIYAKLTKTATDLQGLADEWGRGFIAELDYRTEAYKTMEFNQEMKKRNLNAVTAPIVVQDYSTEQVLVTEWVEGTRLDASDADDVPRLCSVALNAYLVMLLELQSLHCDPHPGNLLRTQDGKLCILDFGMTLDVDPNLQYSLLEYVAHLTSDDYDKLPEDFVALGFLKPEKLDFARRSGVLEPLKYFLKQAGKGGGANGVRDRIFAEYREKYPGLTDDELRVEMRAEMKQQIAESAKKEGAVTGITLEVEELQKKNRDSFQIPEWFLYTSRAFLTLEGISLQADEDYSIIKSCFPYVAKRLLGDDSPRAQKALRDLLYGAGSAVDVKRITDLADGFSTYTTTTKTINSVAGVPGDGALAVAAEKKNVKTKLAETEASITLAKDSAEILLAREGNLMQNILVEESALATVARVKDSLKDTLVDGPQRFRESLPLGVGGFLPPLPFEGIVSPFVEKTEQELKAQELTEKLGQLIQRREEQANAAPVDAASLQQRLSDLNGLVDDLEPEQLALVSREIRENFPKYAPLVARLGSKFVSTLLETASEDIDMKLTELESGNEKPDGITAATARGLSNVAKQGADALAPSS